MEENDKTNMQRLLLLLKKAKPIIASFANSETQVARKIMKHLDEIEREIKSAISS